MVENERTKEITNNLNQKISTFLSKTEYSDKVKLELNIICYGLRVTKDFMKSYGKLPYKQNQLKKQNQMN